jgi:alanine-glyoxylate transaminase/(R)-3-amino-2-methylpropionate-pyruvate transaminase
LAICDEVQTGFGRMGSHYWGFELHGVTPDIVVMAKSIGNGFPLSAVCTTKEIGQGLAGKLHFNTYGGNPVSMAVGRAVLTEIDRLETQKNSLEMGNLLTEGFN